MLETNLFRQENGCFDWPVVFGSDLVLTQLIKVAGPQIIYSRCHFINTYVLHVRHRKLPICKNWFSLFMVKISSLYPCTSVPKGTSRGHSSCRGQGHVRGTGIEPKFSSLSAKFRITKFGIYGLDLIIVCNLVKSFPIEGMPVAIQQFHCYQETAIRENSCFTSAMTEVHPWGQILSLHLSGKYAVWLYGKSPN